MIGKSTTAWRVASRSHWKGRFESFHFHRGMRARGMLYYGGGDSIAVSGAAWHLRAIFSAAAKTALSVPEPRARASWAARACGRLVASLQGLASHRATTCSAK